MEGNQNSGSVIENKLPMKTHGEYLWRVYFRVSEKISLPNVPITHIFVLPMF